MQSLKIEIDDWHQGNIFNVLKEDLIYKIFFKNIKNISLLSVSKKWSLDTQNIPLRSTYIHKESESQYLTKNF